jgi:hypothetical protein
MALHGTPWQSMALNGTPWQIYDELHGNLRPSEISSMALTFSMETIVDGNRWQSMAIDGNQ